VFEQASTEAIKRYIEVQKERDEMLMAFKFRLYPTEQQAQALSAMLETHRRLYNRALSERKDAFETEGRCVRYGEQSAWLKTERRENPSLHATNFSSCQATLRRLDRAFAAFFRRLKDGQKPGYPRFRGTGRFDSVEFPSYGDGCKLEGSHVYFQHIGRVKVKRHRPVEGEIKTVRFKREADGWHVVFSCFLPDPQPEPSQAPAVGIDLGLKSFMVTSEGESVTPPKFYRKAQKALRKAQRALARSKQGSKRRKKAVMRVARQHQRVARKRRDWQHKLALSLIRRYGYIAHEDLNIKGIVRSRLSKSALDGRVGAVSGNPQAQGSMCRCWDRSCLPETDYAEVQPVRLSAGDTADT
jgi:putative transposase